MLMTNSGWNGLFGESLLDSFFDVPSFKGFGSAPRGIMHTDVRDAGDGYEICMDLPGIKKEDVQAQLKDGYLTVNASTGVSEDEEEDGRYIRRERYRGTCSRSFYVGDRITQEDIKAKFENGVLKIDVPKQDAKPAVEDRHYIAIEG